MTDALRNAIQKRANACCEYCRMQQAFSHDPFSAEHILPKAEGGLDDLINLAWACIGCNLIKGKTTHAFDLITGQFVPLYNPRTESWDTHFEWTEDFTIVIGKTPIGRATVTRLQFNRSGLVNLRKALVAFGVHPPL